MTSTKAVKLQLMRMADIPTAARGDDDKLSKAEKKTNFLCVTAPQCDLSMAYNKFLETASPPRGTPGLMIMNFMTWEKEYGPKAVERFMLSMFTFGRPCLDYTMMVKQAPPGTIGCQKVRMEPEDAAGGPSAASSADKGPEGDDMEDVPSPEESQPEAEPWVYSTPRSLHELLTPPAKKLAAKDAEASDRARLDHDIMEDILDQAIEAGLAMNPH